MLAAREASESRAILVESFKRYGQLLDEAIPLVSRTHADIQCWGDLDDEDAGVMADALIDVGRRFAPVAQVVRGVVRAYTWLEVGMITGPRFRKMVTYYLREGFTLRIGFGKGAH